MTAAPAFGYRLADVFAEHRYTGNGVAVFVGPPRMSTDDLLLVTTEVRQFESAYLWPTADPYTFETRIFVVDQELAFAGHPALGAAAVLHERLNHDGPQRWTLRLGERDVVVRSSPSGRGGFDVSMDQGRPEFGPVVGAGSVEDIATGSASGPAAAYLARHRRVDMTETVEFTQGRFLGRPSVMRLDLTGTPDEIDEITLSGHVCLTGSGTLDASPGTP